LFSCSSKTHGLPIDCPVGSLLFLATYVFAALCLLVFTPLASFLLIRMQDSCWTKCIPSMKEEGLSAGEASCVDRCVKKYSGVHAYVGGRLQEVMEKAQG